MSIAWAEAAHLWTLGLRQVDLLFRYDWVFFIGIAVAATGILWLRDRARVRSGGDAIRRVNRRALTFLFWLMLPWVVVGIGVATGALKRLTMR